MALTADDEADQKSSTERAQDAFSGVLANVIFGGHLELASFHAGVLPLFGGGFFHLLGLVGGCALEGRGFFRGRGLELAGPLDGGFPELLGGFYGAIL